MMKRTIFASITILSCIALATAFTGCIEGPIDTTKPVIELIEPEDNDSLRIGGENGVHFEMNLSDTVNQRNAHIHHHDIKIPADATPGEYHLLVYCVDRSGNESMVARTVILSKDAPDDHHHDHE